MRWRVILGLSLAINILLAVGWLWSVRQESRPADLPLVAPQFASTVVKTNVLVRRQFFSWQEVESDDYPTYIKNLHEIGCPEQTIRDIIIADVNALYSRRRATEILTPEQQWWRSLPDGEVSKAAEARGRQLEEERRNLLSQLLGISWESGDLVSLPRPTRTGLPLDGPILGQLPNDVKQAVQEISLRAQDRMSAYIDSRRTANLPLEPTAVANLRQQARTELAQVLSPTQLEEYLLRFSSAAISLRNEFGQLKYFNPSPEEFRSVFRATESLDLQLEFLAGATDAPSVSARSALENQRLAALRNALGPDRFAQYQLLHDTRYQEAYATAVTSGSPDSAGTLYEINRALQEEQTRLRAQTNLSPEQLALELKRAELESLKGTVQALGQELPPEPAPPPKPEPRKIHVLKSGEGLNFIAQLYGVNPSALREANPNIDFTRLKGGEAISIPIRLLPVMPAPAQ